MNFPSPIESSAMGWGKRGGCVREDGAGELEWQQEGDGGRSKTRQQRDVEGGQIKLGGRAKAMGEEEKKLCKTSVSYLLRCIKFPVRVPVLYKIMLMSCGPLRVAACWSWACVAGRYTERTQWDSAFLLRKTSRHLMMNSLSPNVPPFCVENMSAFLNDFGEPGVALCSLHLAGGERGWGRGGGSLCSRLRESIKASADNYKPAERKGWLIVRCSMPRAQPRGLSSTLSYLALLCGPQTPPSFIPQSDSATARLVKKSKEKKTRHVVIINFLHSVHSLFGDLKEGMVYIHTSFHFFSSLCSPESYTEHFMFVFLLMFS